MKIHENSRKLMKMFEMKVSSLVPSTLKSLKGLILKDNFLAGAYCLNEGYKIIF